MKSFDFYTNQVGYEVIETKDGKKHYVTGYISTKDVDLFNDIVTEECLDNMLLQLKSKKIKLDVEHEAYRDNPNIIPVGKIIEAYKDEKGIWVKAELNTASPKFSNVWDSIRNGFIDAFSITFSPIKKTLRDIQGKTVRLLQEVTLLNVALTGNPVNPEACIEKVFVKSMDALLDDKEEIKGDLMEEVKPAEVKCDECKPEETKVVVAPTEEEKAASEASKKLKLEMNKEEDEEDEEEKKCKVAKKAVEDAKITELESKIAELKAFLEKPVFKAMLEEKPKLEVIEKKVFKTGPLDLIK